MSADWDQDDLARLLALEHAVCSLALVSAGNFSFLAQMTQRDAVKTFRSAIESSMLDTGAYPKEINARMRNHLKRIFDHVEDMAAQADEGMPK